ncbi:glutathione S-transferase-like [Trichoplusia ni]|uniref:glutathione transferase n=1 Tax=Trichoplusia ni TaxID=7111 RepID=A0A7E5VVC8_TRINI|nr:glutathione S-transferase-like [Trichoplusia ni]
MAPVFKLKYNDFMGVAEPIRYLLAYGEIKYENVEIKDNVDWIEEKRFPFGKLPVLEVDKKVLYHCVAISRYVGKLVGLLTPDDLEAAELDAIAMSLHEYWQKVYQWYNETNEMKSVLEKELVEKICPKYLGEFQQIVQKKGSYFGGTKLSWVDLYFVAIVESIEAMWGSKILDKDYPKLHLVYKHVHEIPVINAYVSSRRNYKY